MTFKTYLLIFYELLLFCQIITAQNIEIEGVYEQQYCAEYIILKNDSFKYVRRKKFYFYEPNTTILAEGKFRKISDNVLELNTEYPIEESNKVLNVRKFKADTVCKDSIEMRFILNTDVQDSFNIYLSKSNANVPIINALTVGQGITSVRIPRILGEIDYCLSPASFCEMSGFFDEYYSFPYSVMLRERKVCTINEDDDIVEFVLQDSTFFMYKCFRISLKGEYMLIKGDTIFWHGDEFYKQDNVSQNYTLKSSTKVLPIDGLYYNDSTNGWIELKHDTFKCRMPYFGKCQNDAVQAFTDGTYNIVSDSLIVVNTKNPGDWLKHNILIRQYSDNSLPQSTLMLHIVSPNKYPFRARLSVHIHGARCWENISQTFYMPYSETDDTLEYVMPKVYGNMSLCFSLETSEVLNIKKQFEYFSVPQIFKNYELCSIDGTHNVIDLDFSNIKDSPFMYMYLLDEYIKVCDDKLIWHGLVFQKTDNP